MLMVEGRVKFSGVDVCAECGCSNGGSSCLKWGGLQFYGALDKCWFGNGIAGCWLDGDAGCIVGCIVFVSMSWAHGYAGKVRRLGLHAIVGFSKKKFSIQSIIRLQHWTFMCWGVGIALLKLA
jgi:hypothetical protein